MSFLHGAKFSTVTFTNKSFASPSPPKSSRRVELANPPFSERGTVEEPLPSVKPASVAFCRFGDFFPDQFLEFIDPLIERGGDGQHRRFANAPLEFLQVLFRNRFV